MTLTRMEFMSAIGAVREVDYLTDEAYYFNELLEEGVQSQGQSVDTPWHVSFHGSKFPGNNPKACGRQQLYSMLDAPRERFSRKGRMLMDAGKDIENQIVKRWHRAGLLLSDPIWRTQTQYEDPDTWLTSTVDAIVVPRRSTKAVVSELKTKYADDIEAMRRLTRGPDESHVFQLKCQIGFAHEAGPQIVKRCFNTGRMAIDSYLDPRDQLVLMQKPACPQHMHDECLEEVEIEPPDYGFIYYISRDNPNNTWEFFYEYDPAFMEEGRKKLKEWRQNFLDDILPQTNFADKRFAHPFGWKWGDLPCKWCDFGQICRDDMRVAKKTQQHLRLSESEAIDDALKKRPEYTYESARAAVLARWGLKDPGIRDMIPTSTSSESKEAA